MSSENTKSVRTITGQVISTKMDKTILVKVVRTVCHPKYGKYIKRTSKVHAHDGQSQCQQGDKVRIQSCRPLSKKKSWVLVDVLEDVTSQHSRNVNKS